MEGVPQWKRDLLERRRAGAGALSLQSPPAPQSAERRGHADMLLLQPPAAPHDTPRDNAQRDSDEELTYGPGIVKRLQSRYLSLALREANRTRPSVHALRRATSLEHVLDDTPSKPQPPPKKYAAAKQNATRPTRYRQPTRTPEAVRRARSVDALVRCDSRSETEEIASPSHSPERTPTLRPLKPPPLLKDAERPPPDLVKHHLKIFEGRKTRQPSSGQVAEKVKSYTETQPKTRITNGTRLPPRPPPLSPEHKLIPATTQTTPSLLSRPPPSPKKPLNDRDRSVSPVYVNKHPVILSPVKTEFPLLKGMKPFELKTPEVSPRSSVLKSPEPDETDEKNGERVSSPYARTSTPDPETASHPVTTELSLIAQRQDSDRNTSDSSSDDEAVYEVNGDDGPPPYANTNVERSTLESVSKAGTTAQYSFGRTNGVERSHLPSAKDKLVITNENQVAKCNNNNVTDGLVASLASYETTVSDAKLLAPNPNPFVRPPSEGVPATPARDRPRPKDIESSPALVHYESPSPPPQNQQQLTTREIEKNQINKTKSLIAGSKSLIIPERADPSEDADVGGVILVDVKELVSVREVNSGSDVVVKTAQCVETSVVMSNGLGGPRVGARKPQWQQQETTTMLFDFSKRKGVPDYIENDGIIRRRKDKPKVGPGVIAIDGSTGETCTDGASDDEDWALRPPSPCDVAFENDNVLINGRSNIAAGKSRARHLKIQFDESLTRTFEYPSEASLGDEHLNNTTPTSPIGGSLSTYTPSKVALQSETFQLGVTRTQSQPGAEKNGNSTLNNTNGDLSASADDSSSSGINSGGSSEEHQKSPQQTDEIDYLKPCHEDQSHNWSHETHAGAGDLLF